jgi:voltage-gated potassium channel
MPELRFEEIEVRPECGLAGKTIGELHVHDVTGAMIVAIRRLDGSFDATPGPDARLDDGDVVIGVGTTEEMVRLESLFAPREAPVG